MPVPKLKVTCTCATDLLLDRFRATVEAELPPERRITRVHDWETEQRRRALESVLDVEFSDKADADATWAGLRRQTATLALYGDATLSYHQCSHRDATVYASRDSRSGYLEEAVVKSV